MKKNLKHCPFCGNYMINVSPRYSQLSGEIYGYKVECLACYCNMFHENEDRVIEKWNNRKL